jgi:hypothetical protein
VVSFVLISGFLIERSMRRIAEPHRGGFRASTRQFVTFCLDNPAKSWVSVARGCVTLASHHGRHDCAACPTDTGSNRTREGKASYATSGTASDRERDYQRNYCDNLHLIDVIVYIKRFHDRDKSGWWVLIWLIPIIGAIWLLIELGFLKGTPGPNRFGSPVTD